MEVAREFKTVDPRSLVGAPSIHWLYFIDAREFQLSYERTHWKSTLEHGILKETRGSKMEGYLSQN